FALTELRVWDRGTGKTQLVFSGPYVVRMIWSPDGTRLAIQTLPPRMRRMMVYSVTTESDTARTVTVINLRDGRTQKLSEGDLRVDHLLGWSPDGRSLALDSRDVLEVSSSENGTLGIGTGFYSRQWVLDPPTQALQLSPEPLFGRHAGEPR